MINIVLKSYRDRVLKRLLNQLKKVGLLLVCSSFFISTGEAALYQNEEDSSIENILSFDYFVKPEVGSEAYEEEFLTVLFDLRHSNYSEALNRAKKLNEFYPDHVDLKKLVAACYLRGGQWESAKIELVKALELKPFDPSVTRNLALTEMELGNTEKAISLVRDLEKKYPGNIENAKVLAAINNQKNKKTVDIGSLEEALKNNPKDMAIRLQLAKEYMRRGTILKVQDVTKNINVSDLNKESALLELRGKAQLLSGDLDSARATFEQWTKAFPDEADAHFYYGDTLARSGKVEQAKVELERTISLNPRHLVARIAEIKLLTVLNEKGKALDALVKLRKDFGSHIEVLGIEGWFAMGNGNFSKAEQSFSAARKQRPDSVLTINVVRAQWGQKKYDEGISLMREWLKENPSDQDVLLHLAGAYLSLDRNNEAITVYSTVVENNPEYYPALNNLAWLYSDKNLNKALEYAERARQISPKDPFILDTLGMLMLKKGNTSSAYKFVNEAAEILPSDGEIQLHLGRVLLEQKRFPEAKKIFQSIVSQASGTELEIEAKELLNSSFK